MQFPDGTALTQFLLVASLVVVMYWLFFKPMTRLIEARERHIEGAGREAGQAREKSSRILEAYASQIEAARRQGVEHMVEVRHQALERQHRALEETRGTVHEALEKSRREIREAAKESSAALRAQSEAMARMIAERMLGRRLEG